MAKVVPLEAFRYNTERFGKDIARFVAPPYDVIDGVLERRLKEDRLNIAHITLGDEGDAYEIASRRLRTWIDDGVLVKDSGKSYYIYEQAFVSPDGVPRVRSAIVGLVRLEDFSTGVVMPHEKTIPKHRADRMAHICAVRGDTEQIFLLYDDPTGEIEEILQSARKRDEEFRFVDPEGVGHRIVRLAAEGTVRRIEELFVPARLLIADGHHRYETALAYRDEMRARGGSKEGEMPYDYVLAALVSFRNRGLVVYPTHRLVQGVDPKLLGSLPEALGHEFELRPLGGPDQLAKAVEEHKGIAFGIWIPSSNTHLLAVPKGRRKAGDPMEDLPVYIVQEEVLKKCLGFTSDMLDKKVNIEYVKGTGPTKDLMDTEEFQACFFIRPPTVDQVMAIAQTGRKMPHKSTYFYPKIWSGTLLYLF